MRWFGGGWFADRKREAEHAVKDSQQGLEKAENARESTRVNAEYLRGERRKNNWRASVEAAWKASPS